MIEEFTIQVALGGDGDSNCEGFFFHFGRSCPMWAGVR